MSRRKPALSDADKAFIQGFCQAVAMTMRAMVNAEDLLMAIHADRRLLKRAEVDEYDMETLEPALKAVGRELRKRSKRRAKKR